MLKSTLSGLQLTLSLTIPVYLHSFSSCCLPNLRNPAKFSEKFFGKFFSDNFSLKSTFNGLQFSR